MPSKRDVASERSSDCQLAYSVDPLFLRYAPDAIARLGYLHPLCVFRLTENAVEVSASAAILQDSQTVTELLNDIRYQIYRAKIAADGEGLRRQLYHVVFSR